MADNPAPWPAWIMAICSTARTWWPVAVTAGIPVWKFWTWRSERKSGAAELQLKRDEMTADDLAEERREIADRANKYTDRLEVDNAKKSAELAELKAENERLRVEIDRLKDVGRECYQRWREAVHDGNGIITYIVGLAGIGKSVPDPLPHLVSPPPLDQLRGRKAGE